MAWDRDFDDPNLIDLPGDECRSGRASSDVPTSAM